MKLIHNNRRIINRVFESPERFKDFMNSRSVKTPNEHIETLGELTIMYEFIDAKNGCELYSLSFNADSDRDYFMNILSEDKYAFESTDKVVFLDFSHSGKKHVFTIDISVSIIFIFTHYTSIIIIEEDGVSSYNSEGYMQWNHGFDLIANYSVTENILITTFNEKQYTLNIMTGEME